MIREAVLSPNYAAERVDFQGCLGAMDAMIREVPPLVPKIVRKLYRDLRDNKYAPDEDIGSDEDLSTNEDYVKVFAAWVALTSNPSTRRHQLLGFIVQMHEQGILSDEDISTAFFRVNLQMAIGSFYKFPLSNQANEVYRVIDSLAELFVHIIEFNGDGDRIRILYLTKLLSLVVMVFMDMREELAEQFQQRPFYRLFSSMLTFLLRDKEEVVSPIEFEILVVFGEAFSVLQPTFFPDFTFSWWNLVSHRFFMPKLLLLPEKKVSSRLSLPNVRVGQCSLDCSGICSGLWNRGSAMEKSMTPLTY